MFLKRMVMVLIVACEGIGLASGGGRDKSLTVQELYLKGNEEVSKDDYLAAEVFYRECLRMDPGHGDARLNLGNCLLRQDRIEEAQETFENLLKTDPENALALNSLGVCHMKRGQYQEALTCYGKAVEADPDYGSAKRNLQEAMRLLDKMAQEMNTDLDPSLNPVQRLEALVAKENLRQAYAEAMKLKERSRVAAEALSKLGIKCLYADLPKDAEAVGKIIAECEGGEKLALYVLGVAKRMQGLSDEAVPLLEKAHELCPQDLSPALELGQAYQDRGIEGDDARARSCFLECQKMNSEEVRSLVYLSALDVKEGLWSDAEKRCRRVLELEGESARMRFGLGLALQNQKRYKEAEECMRKSLEIDPQFEPARLHLGIILWESGEPDEAMEIMEAMSQSEDQEVRVRAVALSSQMKELTHR